MLSGRLSHSFTLVGRQRTRVPWFRAASTMNFPFLERRVSSPVLNNFARGGLSTRLDMAKRSTATFKATDVHINKDRPYQLVIVESPSKCKTIQKILDQYVKDHQLDFDYVVTSCMGHVRNLPRSREKGSDKEKQPVVGIDIHNQYEPVYEILPGKEGLVKELQSLAKEAQQVLLATDEDREGEAVAWHLTQVLSDTVPYQRVTFTEITPTAINAAIQDPHSLNHNLVQAQETRRVLDRLAGYTLSPVLWKKIAPGLSAGRVQSVGMALIVQRERERLLFKSAEYYDAEATFSPGDVVATLVAVNGTALAGGGDFDNQGTLRKSHKLHLLQQDAEDLIDLMKGERSTWTVASVQSKQRTRKPPMPFTTSTLQQEANNRLGMSVAQTMSFAQSLYESGFISYMRTDSTHLSQDAHGATEQVIQTTYGSDLVAPARNSKSKNAQEAHEAIRPAIQPDGAFLRPEQLSGEIKNDASSLLYELIYKRTLASRMASQVVNQTSVEIKGTSPGGDTTASFRLSGSVEVLPGFTLALGRSSEDTILPLFSEGQILRCNNITAISHSTKAPPRFTEASFVKELEGLGVGRPSTYAGTIKILRDRAYVGTPVRADDTGGSRRRNSKPLSGSAISAQRAAGGEDFTGSGRGPLVPSLSAFVVCSLLENNCATYVDPGFTAKMEERLDQIARGENEGDENMRVKYLDEFYAGDDGLAAKVKRIDEAVSADEARRASLPSLFTESSTGDDGTDIGLYIGPWGPYIQRIAHGTTATDEKPPSAPLPPGMAADLSTITPQTLNTLLASREQNGVILGNHPDDDRPIRLKIGRFGAFLQWGEDDQEGTTTHSLPKNIGSMRNLNYEAALESNEPGAALSNMIGLTLEQAVAYTRLPRTVCTFQELPIVAAIGPYGPYLKFNNSFVSLNQKDGDVLTVDSETAERLVTDGIINKTSKLGRGVLAELGEKDGDMVRVKEGRYGVYINWKRINAKMPSEYLDRPEELPIEEAWQLIQEKGPPTKKTTKTKSSEPTLPPAPKRPKSAYLFFCADLRPRVVEESGQQSLGEVAKELARRWKETETTARQKYQDLADAAKQDYQEEKVKWETECQSILGKEKASKKSTSPKKKSAAKKSTPSKKKSAAKPSSSTLPKRPKSAYLFFCAEKRTEVMENTKSLGAVSKELARQWAETTDRTAYEAQAASDKLRYQEELEKVTSTDGKNGLVNGTAKTPSKKKSGSATTSPRAPSAYMLFCADHRKEVQINQEDGRKLPFGEITKRLALMWRECDDEKRQEYQERAQERKEELLQAAGS